MRNHTAHALIAAAALAVTSTAMAQYRVGDQGHANDANNRIGSGGYNSNTDVSQRSLGVTNSQILTGNSTGLSYFHGNSQIFDPNNLQVNTQTGASDTLNAIAAPQNLSARTTNAPQFNTVRPYYSTAQVNQLPAPNYVQTPGGAGLVPVAPLSQQANDTRLGVIAPVGTYDQLPNAGQLNQPGPVDTSSTFSRSLSASALTGIRELNTSDPNDSYFLSRYADPQNQTRGGQLDNAAIQRMRNELNSTLVNQQNGAEPGDDRTQFNSKNPGQPNPDGQPTNNAQVNNPNLNQSTNAPNNAALSNTAMGTNLAGQSIAGSLNTGQGTRQTLLVSPADQSTQLADLERKMRDNKGPVSDQQANANYNEALRLKKQGDADKSKKDASAKSNQPKLNGTAAAGGGVIDAPDAKPVFIAPPTINKPEVKTAPTVVNGPLNGSADYVVTSLATGVKAAGLAKVMKSAENDMRSGKFTSALDSYDTAAAVAPNNPFVTLGRGYAELGASYYGKSEGDLRRTFTTEPAVLLGRYDLNGFLGEDRVGFVTRDLRDIANGEKTAVRPLFLLAYIEHNTNDDATATTDLIEAQKRAGGNDAVIAQMQKLWGLPTK